MASFPKMSCEICGKPARYLLYCSHCHRAICINCYDPFIGTCKKCVLELFYGNISASLKVNKKQEESSSSMINPEEMGVCPECGGKIVTTPDGTRCCSSCGLVIGAGYSWMGSSNAPRESDAWHQYEYLYEKSLERYERIVRRHGRRL